MATSALVLFSGGQDSTICLAWALHRFDRVETVGFNYGQRHTAELAARPRILEKLRAGFAGWTIPLGEDHLLPLDVFTAIGGSAQAYQGVPFISASAPGHTGDMIPLVVAGQQVGQVAAQDLLP